MTAFAGPAAGRPLAVTALFPDRSATEAVVADLLRTGLPRDQIEVVVTPAVASREFADVRPRPRNRALVGAAAGGFLGLLFGSLLGLALVWLPGMHDVGVLAVAQLLGPNVATVVGAVIGAAIGFFRRPGESPRHDRLDEAPDQVLVTVSARSREEAEFLAGVLEEHGGAPRIDDVG